ncbi:MULTISPECIES: RHS repeat-associated core domain-containing protein [unclassified Lysobacter]|uniref:RHS repeat domain-containing protein n=1 Tax=unclassified Lysobacter TaxID=2635362 RepID=UPI001BE8C572|nr:MULTISPECIES: RHS repeat-associated core domain-containing protein [unclassified Lysobacter]MBT2750023.1 hypothetical protein [Lysobacter sp. ISL-50]MBT2775405.1 hypothetical protein [Lysobacter sp. ISL-54]MBT2783528.1 hypothetical protein [Lysobacter sp. ISL-52]
MKWISKLFATALLAVATFAAPAQTVVEYIHTDALGSPVAITDANQQVIEHSEYEPYGLQVNRTIQDGPGYTGHVSDAATGLSYMQQRYFDSSIGKFLSVDPVTVDVKMGANFNRYWYANNNPYKFIDPDGRYVCTSGKPGAPCSIAQVGMVEGGIKDIRAARNSYKAGSTQYNVLSRALKFLGKAGEDNNVTVNIDTSHPTPGSAKTSGGKTTLSVNPSFSKQVGQGNPAVERADLAATILHESNHGIDQRRFGMAYTIINVNWSEKRASAAEAMLFKGLGRDSAAGLWTRANGINANAIERQADASTAIWQCESREGACR